MSCKIVFIPKVLTEVPQDDADAEVPEGFIDGTDVQVMDESSLIQSICDDPHQANQQWIRSREKEQNDQFL